MTLQTILKLRMHADARRCDSTEQPTSSPWVACEAKERKRGDSELRALCVLLWLTMLSASAATRYVWQESPSPAPPYGSWATAATNIQDAVDAADPGDEVVATNGVYAAGGRAVGTNLVGNRVVVDKRLTLRSVNGPEFAIITGFKVPSGFLGCGDGAKRCVWLASGATLSGFTLTNGATRIDGDYALEQSGGGVWCESQTAVVSNCVLTGNGAWFGGGAYSGTLDHCALSRNSARTNGGGVCGSTLLNCTLTGNSSRFYDGGGAFRCTLSSCILTSNQALNAWGGGASESTLDHCILNGNKATDGGGAFYGTLDYCSLANNSAGFTGGGACLAAMTNCTLSGNSAGTGGGTYSGILDHCTLTGNRATRTGLWTGGGGAAGGTLVSCRLDQNVSAGYGGGVTGNLGMEGSPTALLINCVLTGNSAQQGGGANGATLYNCTLTGNSAGTGGGASGSALWNCIIYFNSATNLDNYSPQAPYGPLNYCCTWPMPTSGIGNITNTPLFLDLAGGNLRLQSNSPCINAGNNSSLTCYDYNTHSWFTNLFDLDGNPRIVSGTVDIGAYENTDGSTINGIPWAWLLHYGLPTDGSADYVDSDQDGHNAWQEWKTWTDPTNALSVLKLLTPQPDTIGMAISWQCVLGQNYFLERATNVIAPFSLLQSNITGQAGVTSFTDTNATDGGAILYRVGVP